jgi:hypothetical protein
MSVTYRAAVLYGTTLDIADLEAATQVPNPLFGKCKFDPDTGEKVEKFTSNLDYDRFEEEAEALALLCVRKEGDDTIYLGVPLATADATYQEDSDLSVSGLVATPDRLLKAEKLAEERIKKLYDKFKLTGAFKLSVKLVTYCT